MIYILCFVFFVLGILIGLSFGVWVFGKMAEQGNLVFKSDGEWTGERGALQEVSWQFVHTEKKKVKLND
jgi:hypothetical protein